MKKTAVILSAIFLIVLLVHGKYLLSDGFSPRRITYLGPYKTENEIEHPLNAKCLYIFDQEFSYLGRGGQTFVFESADKKYVLKFIRYHKYKVPFTGEIREYLNLISKSYQTTMDAKKNRYNLVMKSYKIAYSFLPEVTLVEYVHLNQTDFLNKKIVVKDKSSRKHVVDLDKVAFIIQRKVNGLDKVIQSSVKNNEKDEVCKLIDSFFDCITFLAKNNIVNRDYPNMLRNSGVLGQKYIMTDVGSFFLVPENRRDYLQHQFSNFTDTFRSYIKESAPEHLSFYDNRLKKEMSCLSF